MQLKQQSWHDNSSAIGLAAQFFQYWDQSEVLPLMSFDPTHSMNILKLSNITIMYLNARTHEHLIEKKDGNFIKSLLFKPFGPLLLYPKDCPFRANTWPHPKLPLALQYQTRYLNSMAPTNYHLQVKKCNWKSILCVLHLPYFSNFCDNQLQKLLRLAMIWQKFPRKFK